MDITTLEISCDAKGKTRVNVWAKCHSPQDVDDIIAWLRLSKNVIEKWEKISARSSAGSEQPPSKRQAAGSNPAERANPRGTGE